MAAATALASRAAAVCSAPSTEPPLWQVDPNLRPEGKDGVLVRRVESHRAYYERWAESWEFQALLKASTVAGDLEVGQAYLDAVWPFVWTAVERDGFVQSAQAMRKRVETHIPLKEKDREIKLGPGGLRDVEFTIQLIQLVHGRSDPVAAGCAAPSRALRALRDGGYVGRTQAAALDRGYRQLRVWEHRLQLRKLSRTHLMPDTEEDKRILARASGFATVGYMEEVWDDVRRDVRAMHLEMFYRPILGPVAQLSADEAALSEGRRGRDSPRLASGIPAGAQRHIAALTQGLCAPRSDPAAAAASDDRLVRGGRRSGRGTARLQAAGGAAGGHASGSSNSCAIRGPRPSASRSLLSTSGFVTKALLTSAQHITWLDNDDDLAPCARRAARPRGGGHRLPCRRRGAMVITALRGLRRREVVRTAAANVLALQDSVTAATSVTHAADVLMRSRVAGRHRGRDDRAADSMSLPPRSR